MAELSVSFIKRLRNLSEGELVELCFKMAALHGDTFERLVMDLPAVTESPVGDRDQIIQYSGGHVNFTGKQMIELRAFGGAADKKVTMIKTVREMTGLGLKEAKDLVEEVFIK